MSLVYVEKVKSLDSVRLFIIAVLLMASCLLSAHDFVTR